jgi:hypothetical protein
MMHLYAFWALLIGSCGYAIWRGGAPERIVGAALLIAALATSLVLSELRVRFFHVELGALVVDSILFMVLAIVAMRADRRWPMLLAGLQLGTIAMHLLKFWHSDIIRVVYAFTIAAGSYPMIAALAVGTWRHQRRLKIRGHDLSWTIRGKGRAA